MKVTRQFKDFFESEIMGETEFNRFKTKTEIRAAANSTCKKLAVQCTADTFSVNQSLVVGVNICGKNRHFL